MESTTACSSTPSSQPSADRRQALKLLALLGGVSLLFAGLACWFFSQGIERERETRLLREDRRMLLEEKERLEGTLTQNQERFQALEAELQEAKAKLSGEDQTRSLAVAEMVHQKQQNEQIEAQLKSTLSEQQKALEKERETLTNEKKAFEQEKQKFKKEAPAKFEPASSASSQKTSSNSKTQTSPHPKSKPFATR